MDTIDGVWIMKGCRRTDKDCLHSPEDLLDLVREVGFLPLFSNSIPGFSVGGHTPASDWWQDDPATDPWASSLTKKMASSPGNGSPGSPITAGTDTIMRACTRTAS